MRNCESRLGSPLRAPPLLIPGAILFEMQSFQFYPWHGTSFRSLLRRQPTLGSVNVGDLQLQTSCAVSAMPVCVLMVSTIQYGHLVLKYVFLELYAQAVPGTNHNGSHLITRPCTLRALFPLARIAARPPLSGSHSRSCNCKRAGRVRHPRLCSWSPTQYRHML